MFSCVAGLRETTPGCMPTARFCWVFKIPAGGAAASAVQEEHKLFLTDAANHPDSLQGAADANRTDDIAAAMRRVSQPEASNTSSQCVKHTYGFKSGERYSLYTVAYLRHLVYLLSQCVSP